MAPVECGTCGITVQVSKNSAAQTSIQWEVDSVACPRRAELALGETCPHLSDSIRDAVFAGRVEVPEGEL
jgi:hypothetical protein